ncbi:MAG: PAS domain S-box protein, partial [Candidatus Methanofastidiosa archaeon]|nr:PAS domain S-box protein [Candidatus Methanofastidiosa archaeon]
MQHIQTYCRVFLSWKIDNNSKFIDANRVACKILGYSKDELLNMKMEEIMPLNNIEIGGKSWQEFLNKGTQKEECRFLRKDGTNIIEYVVIANIIPGLHLFSINDITERKKVEDKLKEALTIINKSHSVAFTWKNAEGWPVEFVSENVEKLFGYNTEDFISGKVSYSRCIHPDDLTRVANEVEKYSNEKGTAEFMHAPYRIITKEGKINFVSDWTFIVRNSDGHITHYKGIVEDITERKNAEDRLRSTNRQLEDIIEFLPDATFIIDKDKKIIAWNRAMEVMTSISK